MADRKLKYIKVDKNDGISWVTMNRPEKRNAMSPALHEEMDQTLFDDLLQSWKQARTLARQTRRNRSDSEAARSRKKAAGPWGFCHQPLPQSPPCTTPSRRGSAPPNHEG